MKIHGQEIKGPSEDVLVIPRPLGTDIVFKVRAVLDYTEFDALCPVPVPGMVLNRGETVAKPDIEDSDYKKQMGEWATKRTNFLFLKSLEATPGLEWATVKMNDPSTWNNYKKELEEAQLTTNEVVRILNKAAEVNGLDEDKFEQARQRFLASAKATVS